MAHPYAGKTQGSARAKAITRAEGGKINPATGSPSRPLSSHKSEMDTPGAPPGQYYGTSMEPGPRGYKVEGPFATGSRARTTYAPTQEGRRASTRQMDKMDNEYGAYRHRRKTLTDGME